MNAPSVDAVVDVLLQCEAYQQLSLRRGDVTAETLERHLRAYLARALRTSSSFLNGAVRDFVQWRWRRFEVNNLLVLLRGLHRGAPAERIRSLMVSLEGRSELDWEALVSASSPAGLADRLARRPHGALFSQALRGALKEYERTGLVFALETALTLAYHAALRRRMSRLRGTDAQAARALVGSFLDGHIVISAFRYRTFFDFDPEQILSHSLSRGVKVGPETVQRIASGASLRDAVQAVWGQRIQGLPKLAERTPRASLVEFEKMFRGYLHAQALTALRKPPLTLYPLLAYERLLEDEIDDLVTIIECAGIGIDPPERRRHLIGDRGRP